MNNRKTLAVSKRKNAALKAWDTRRKNEAAFALLSPGKKAAITRSKNIKKMTPEQKKAYQEKLSNAGKKAAVTRKMS